VWVQVQVQVQVQDQVQDQDQVQVQVQVQDASGDSQQPLILNMLSETLHFMYGCNVNDDCGQVVVACCC